MKVTFRPDNQKWECGFDYFCAECHLYLGNSLRSKRLEHPSKMRKGIFRTVTLLQCSNIGKVCEMPKHEIDCKEL